MTVSHDSGDCGSADLDEATRLLCIGAHLDRKFADEAIREFLTQPARALPPSLGVNPKVVLRECLAARRRRRERDAVLFILMVIFAVLGLPFLLAWIVVAVGWRQIGPSRRRLDRVGRSVTGVRAVVLIVVGIGLGVPLLFGALAGTAVTLLGGLAGSIETNQFEGPYGSESGGAPLAGGRAMFLWSLLVSCAMFAVLWFDRYAVWSIITGRLRRGRFGLHPPTSRLGRFTWNIGNSVPAFNLSKVDAPHVNCVVYRGGWPFVGSGQPFQPWSIVIALESIQARSLSEIINLGGAEGSDPLTAALSMVEIQTGGDESGHTKNPASESSDGMSAVGSDALSIIGLHNAVTRDIVKLAGESPLSPSRRLVGLRTEGMVYIPARALAHQRGRPELGEVFGSGHGRPSPQISGSLLQRTAATPQEWMRYYANYVVESWDREVTVSVLVHYGLDDRNLYVECTPCALRPVTQRYRNADGLSDGLSVPAFLDALGSWAVLPLTIIQRFTHSVAELKDDYHGRDDVERFGAAISLRELAASQSFADYAQESDVNRYAQILQTRIVRAIGAYLESCGLSSVEFMRQADTVAVNNVVLGGVHNSNLGGRGNVVVTGGGSGPNVAGR